MNNLKGKRVSYLASDCLHFSKHGIKDQFCCSIFSRFLLLCSCIHLIHPFDCIDTTSSFQANWFQFVSFDVVDDRYGHGRPANLQKVQKTFISFFFKEMIMSVSRGNFGSSPKSGVDRQVPRTLQV